MNELAKIIDFFAKRFQDETIDENTLLFEIIDNSIDFVTALSELEEEIEREVCIEEIEDITKTTIGDLIKYLE